MIYLGELVELPHSCGAATHVAPRSLNVAAVRLEIIPSHIPQFVFQQNTWGLLNKSTRAILNQLHD